MFAMRLMAIANGCLMRPIITNDQMPQMIIMIVRHLDLSLEVHLRSG